MATLVFYSGDNILIWLLIRAPNVILEVKKNNPITDFGPLPLKCIQKILIGIKNKRREQLCKLDSQRTVEITIYRDFFLRVLNP